MLQDLDPLNLSPTVLPKISRAERGEPRYKARGADSS
jgi:hypothetical protein